jgi:UDP-glucose 4-epimerase
VHLGVYEPYARSSPRSAIERTAAGTLTAVMASVDAGSLDRIVVRSGIEIYGRRRRAPMQPDEDVRPDPTSPFGHQLLHVERVCMEGGLHAAIPVTRLRFAPLVGPSFPSPLGRYLRMPAVPFQAFGDPPFSMLHQDDAASALLAALRRPHDGPVNVVGGGAVTASQAARLGRRLPVPTVALGWQSARLFSEVAGAPIPAHMLELPTRGRDQWAPRPARRAPAADDARGARSCTWSEIVRIPATGQAGLEAA